MLRKKLKTILIVLVVLLIVLILARVVAGYVMQWRFEAKVAALRQAGEPVTLAEMAPPPVPDNENAALLCLEAFRRFQALPEEVRNRIAELQAKREPWTAEEGGEARELLLRAADVIVAMQEITQRRGWSLETEWNEPDSLVHVERLSQLRSLSGVVTLGLRVHAAQGDGNAVVRHVLIMMQLARPLSQRPVLIDFLAGEGLMAVAMRRLQDAMSALEIPERGLEEIRRAHAGYGDRSRWVRAMKGERCYAIHVVRKMADHPDLVLAGGDQHPGIVDRLWCEVTGPLIVYHAGIGLLDAFEGYLECAERPWFEARQDYARFSGLSAGQNMTLRNAFAALSFLGTERATIFHEQAIAFGDCAETAIALALHRIRKNRYPAVLSELVPELLGQLPTDPFSGKSLIYRREDGGFTVYSLGPNMRDDGGREPSKESEGDDIVWRCSR